MSDNMTRRERREQERGQRGRRPSAPAARGRRRIPGIWIGLGVVAIGVALVLGAQALGIFQPGAQKLDLRSGKFDPQGEVIGQKMPDEGNGHIPQGQKASYKQSPPTSGQHWAQPAAPTPWGIKDATLPDEVILHNLEHGGIVIFYSDLNIEDTAKLKDLVRSLINSGTRKIVLEPYPQLRDAKVAVSAWDWQLKLPAYDDVKIVKFVRSHYDGPDAPEPGVP